MASSTMGGLRCHRCSRAAVKTGMDGARRMGQDTVGRAETIRVALSILSTCWLLGFAIVMYVTFLHAYFNGGYLSVRVDLLNEQYLEFVLIPIVLVLAVVGQVLMLREVMQ